MQTKLGDVIGRLQVAPERPDDDVIDHDLILVWGAQRRIITGADLLGRLLRDIVTLDGVKATPQMKEAARQCRYSPYTSTFSAAMKASCGMSTLPNWRMRFLPSFCLSSSLRLRETSPP